MPSGRTIENMNTAEWSEFWTPEVSEAMTDSANRRRYKRYPASGPVTITYDDPFPVLVEGKFLDRSMGGFRARHQNAALQMGQEVQFTCELSSGRARVAWTRDFGTHVESGFEFIDRQTIH